MAITNTFNWYPDIASDNTETPTVNVTKFGDGYEARVANVINVIPQSWSVTFTRGRDSGECQAIWAFLRARKGVQAFNWTNPFGEAGVYVARKWTSTSNEGFLTVKTTFEQVFES